MWVKSFFFFRGEVWTWLKIEIQMYPPRDLSFFVGRLQNGVQQNIGSGFAVFPAGIFHLDMASAAEAGDKNHRRWANLVHVTGVVACAADHMQAAITQFIRNVENPLHHFFIKG